MSNVTPLLTAPQRRRARRTQCEAWKLAQDITEATTTTAVALFLAPHPDLDADWYREEGPRWAVEGVQTAAGGLVELFDICPHIDHDAQAGDYQVMSACAALLVDVAGVATRQAGGCLRLSFDAVRRLVGKAEPAGAVSLFGSKEDLADYGWAGRAV